MMRNRLQHPLICSIKSKPTSEMRRPYKFKVIFGNMAESCVYYMVSGALYLKNKNIYTLRQLLPQQKLAYFVVHKEV